MTRQIAIQAGLIIGVFCAGLVLPVLDIPFGIDAPAFLIGYPQESAPGYLRLILKPIGQLPPTLAIAVLSAITLTGCLLLANAAQANPWIAVLAAPVVYTVWLGQMGGIVTLGAALAYLVVADKLPAGWGGIAVLLLLVKPQAGGLLALYVLFTLLKRDRLDFYWSLYAICAVLLLSAVVFGSWLGPWLEWIQNRTVVDSVENLGLGLLAAPLLTILIVQMPPTRRMALLLVLNPLLSPYVQHYDFAVLVVVMGCPGLALASWAAVFLRITTGSVAWLWWIPFGALWWWIWREANLQYEGGRKWRFLLAT